MSRVSPINQVDHRGDSLLKCCNAAALSLAGAVLFVAAAGADATTAPPIIAVAEAKRASSSSFAVFSPVVPNPCTQYWQFPSADNSLEGCFNFDSGTTMEIVKNITTPGSGSSSPASSETQTVVVTVKTGADMWLAWFLDNYLWQFLVPLAIGILMIFPMCLVLLIGRYFCDCFGSDRLRPGHICCGGRKLDELDEPTKIRMYNPRCITATKIFAFFVAFVGVAGVALSIYGGISILLGLFDVMNASDDLLNWFLSIVSDTLDGIKNPDFDANATVTADNSLYPVGFNSSDFESVADDVKDIYKTYITDSYEGYKTRIFAAILTPAFFSVVPGVMLLVPAFAALANIRKGCPTTFTILMSFPCQFLYFLITTLLLIILVGLDIVCDDVNSDRDDAANAPSISQWYIVPMCEQESPFATMNTNMASMEYDLAGDACTELLTICSNSSTVYTSTSGSEEAARIFYCEDLAPMPPSSSSSSITIQQYNPQYCSSLEGISALVGGADDDGDASGGGDNGGSSLPSSSTPISSSSTTAPKIYLRSSTALDPNPETCSFGWTAENPKPTADPPQQGESSYCSLRDCVDHCDSEDRRNTAKDVYAQLSAARRVHSTSTKVLKPWEDCHVLYAHVRSLGPEQVCTTLQRGLAFFTYGSIALASGMVLALIVSFLGRKRFVNNRKFIEQWDAEEQELAEFVESPAKSRRMAPMGASGFVTVGGGGAASGRNNSQSFNNNPNPLSGFAAPTPMQLQTSASRNEFGSVRGGGKTVTDASLAANKNASSTSGIFGGGGNGGDNSAAYPIDGSSTNNINPNGSSTFGPSSSRRFSTSLMGGGGGGKNPLALSGSVRNGHAAAAAATMAAERMMMTGPSSPATVPAPRGNSLPPLSPGGGGKAGGGSEQLRALREQYNNGAKPRLSSSALGGGGGVGAAAAGFGSDAFTPPSSPSKLPPPSATPPHSTSPPAMVLNGGGGHRTAIAGGASPSPSFSPAPSSPSAVAVAAAAAAAGSVPQLRMSPQPLAPFRITNLAAAANSSNATDGAPTGAGTGGDNAITAGPRTAMVNDNSTDDSPMPRAAAEEEEGDGDTEEGDGAALHFGE